MQLQLPDVFRPVRTQGNGAHLPETRLERRLAEAARIGFGQAFLAGRGIPARGSEGLELVPTDHVRDLMERLFS